MSDSGRVIGENNPYHPNYEGGRLMDVWEVRCDPEHGTPYVAAVGVSGPIMLAEDDGPAGLKALHDAALAHNAFDVMMRRGWSWRHCKDGYYPIVAEEGEGACPGEFLDCPVKNWPDPYTALVEADQWMREKEAKNG